MLTKIRMVATHQYQLDISVDNICCGEERNKVTQLRVGRTTQLTFRLDVMDNYWDFFKESVGAHSEVEFLI